MYQPRKTNMFNKKSLTRVACIKRPENGNNTPETFFELLHSK